MSRLESLTMEVSNIKGVMSSCSAEILENCSKIVSLPDQSGIKESIKELEEKTISNLAKELKELKHNNPTTSSRTIQHNERPHRNVMKGRVTVDAKHPDHTDLQAIIKKRVPLVELGISRAKLSTLKNKGCLIEVPELKDAQKIGDILMKSVDASKLIVKIPKGPVPVIKLIGINKDMNREDLINYVKKMSSLPNIDIRPFRHHEDRFNRNTWFATIDGDSFTSLKTASTLENGLLRLHGNWTSLSWTEDFSPRRCGKCAGFHGTKVCQKEETLCLKCGASDHQSANCKEAPKKTNGELTKTADETFAYFISQKYLDTTSDTDTTPFELQDSGQQHYYPLISMVEISSAIRTMGHKKAPGPDGIMRNPILFLNDEHPVILNNLYNACLFLGYFPQAWKIGHIIFLQKKDKDPRDITSLRPITLLNLFGKILDKIIVNRITYHLQVTNRLNDSQFGFRWGKSCEEALRKVKDILHKSRLANNHSIVISMDIEGAFDNASWDIIRESLKEKEVPPYLRTMIHSYLCSRKVSSDASPQSLIDPLQITRGCPQGSNSGPLFWILYMDPIFSILKDENVHTIAYADDLLLICTSTSRVKVENITNRALETLHTWITSRKLNIAPKKSAALYVAPAGRNKGAGKGGVRNPVIRMDGNHILFKNTLKFLGVTFNRHLTWVDHAKSIRDKVLSKGMELRRLTRENRGLAPLVTKRLYKAGFERIICYAASVWWRQENNSLTHKILSSAQRPFALAICRGYNTLSTDAALVLSGLVPINNILTLESKRAELIRPGSDMDTDPTPEQVDSPPLQWYCHPAEVHLITYDKSIPDSSYLTIYTDGSKSDDGVGA
ncbi:hypothetical protein LAZ67_3000313, partial [Cordylochernes scorpioides]